MIENGTTKHDISESLAEVLGEFCCPVGQKPTKRDGGLDVRCRLWGSSLLFGFAFDGFFFSSCRFCEEEMEREGGGFGMIDLVREEVLFSSSLLHVFVEEY